MRQGFAELRSLAQPPNPEYAGVCLRGRSAASEGLLVPATAWSVFIPAGSFAQSGKSGPYRFSGTIAGAQVDATLNGHSNGRWDLDLSADNAPETLPDPTLLTITLGDDRGGISVHPVIHH